MIQVVVSCTDRKSIPPSPWLRASSLPSTSVEERLETWLDRLGRAADSTSARSLYQGEHWAVARDLDSRGVANVWVASAGFGLVAIDAQMTAYQATFARGVAESVLLPESPVSADEQRSFWWAGVQESACNGRATIAQLIAEGPVVVAASKPYLTAMARELVDAASLEGARLVVSTTGEVPFGLREFKTPADGRVRNVLGGSMQAVNVRLAAALVESLAEEEFSLAAADHVTAKIMASAPPLNRFERRQLTDAEVKEFIRQFIIKDAGQSRSSMLRHLRNAGLACEQGRFRDLYNAVREAM